MAKRIQPTDEEEVKPDPVALRELYQLVAALPEDVGDWWYVSVRGNIVPRPSVMAFWHHVCLTAFMVVQTCWPDRQKFLEWATNPYSSPFGPSGPTMPYPSLPSYLRPRKAEP
jgi:hypothetical protein